jgi:PleD family two-component response regulator
VGDTEVLARGYDWLENLVRTAPDDPIIVIVAEPSFGLVERVLEAGAAECLLESEVRTAYLREAIREAIAHKGIEKEVRALSASPSNAPVNDRLTGLMSSEMAGEFLEAEFRSAARGNRDVACLLVQAVGLDEISESYGTAFANVALREMGKSLKRLVRHADVLSRLSGA